MAEETEEKKAKHDKCGEQDENEEADIVFLNHPIDHVRTGHLTIAH